MNKYKYSINCNYTNLAIAINLAKELEKLGYIKDEWFDRDVKCSDIFLINKKEKETSFIKNGQFGVVRRSANKRDFTFNIDNKWEYEAALAIAAIRGNNKPHIGEWIKALKSGELVSGNLYKIRKTKEDLTCNTPSQDAICVEGIESGDYSGTTNLNGRYCRKATPEEIIEYMKEKYKVPTLPEKPKNWLVKIKTEEEGAEVVKEIISILGNCLYNGIMTNYYYGIRNGISIREEKVVHFKIVIYNSIEEWRKVFKSETTKTNNQMKSFSIKGPINQYPDLLAFFKSKEHIEGNYSYYYEYDASTDIIGYESRPTYSVITYEQWKSMYYGDKKIIGYKLIKEYPNAEVGFGVTVELCALKKYGLENTDFSKYKEYWEPQYEQEKKEITIRVECDEPFDVTIVKNTTEINIGKERISINELKAINKIFYVNALINGWTCTPNTVNIGCKKNIPYHYISKIIETYEQLNAK